MQYFSHLSFGAAISQVAVLITGEPVSTLIGAMIGSLVPDIDKPKSFIGRRTPQLPEWLYAKWGHRTITHSLQFLFPFTALTMPFIFIKGFCLSGKHMWVGLVLGCISHLIADSLNPNGIRFFYPSKRPLILFGGKIQLYSRSELMFTLFSIVVFTVALTLNLTRN
jgi:inner membrane protein